MWISQQMIESGGRKRQADVATVTGDGAAQGAQEYRSLPFAGPWGNAAQAVIVSTSAGDTCIGALAQDRGLQPGELMLFSSGGAEIYLKSSGEIEINGQTFAAKGAN